MSTAPAKYFLHTSLIRPPRSRSNTTPKDLGSFAPKRSCQTRKKVSSGSGWCSLLKKVPVFQFARSFESGCSLPARRRRPRRVHPRYYGRRSRGCWGQRKLPPHQPLWLPTNGLPRRRDPGGRWRYCGTSKASHWCSRLPHAPPGWDRSRAHDKSHCLARARNAGLFQPGYWSALHSLPLRQRPAKSNRRETTAGRRYLLPLRPRPGTILSMFDQSTGFVARTADATPDVEALNQCPAPGSAGEEPSL